MTKVTDEAEREEAKRELRKLLKPGATVHTILRHVSASGMSRVIDLAIPYVRVDEVPRDPALRVTAGLVAYAKTGDRAWQRGVTVLGAIPGRAAISYPDGHTESYPREEVTIYVQRRRIAIRSIGWLAAKAMGDTFDADRQGIKVPGCGMDMGFHVVYGLGRTLWPKGTRKPHGTRNGSPDRDGGYALKQAWL